MRPDRRRRERLRAHAELRMLRARARRLAGARPVAKNGLHLGVVVWAHVPFQDGDGKLRPAVVTARRGHTVVVRPVTSQPRRLAQAGYGPLERWAEAGLVRRSAVRQMDVPIALADIVCIVGELHPDDVAVAFTSWPSPPPPPGSDSRLCRLAAPATSTP